MYSELEALQIEKRNLHAYLKGYERFVHHHLTIHPCTRYHYALTVYFGKKLSRDFSRMHGRPVTKHADIQPVAHEYQRYKVSATFKLINWLRGSL